MPKGDDHIQKKKSKAIRKRMRRAGADSLEAIQGVQAAKRRRQFGTRRVCEGMCYTLPTEDDPFNERNDQRRRRKENRKLRKKEVPAGEILEFETYADMTNESNVDTGAGYDKQLKRKRVSEDRQGEIELKALQNSPKCRKVEERDVNPANFVVDRCCNRNIRRRSSNLENSHILNLCAPSANEPDDVKGGAIDELVLAAISEAGLLSEDFSSVYFMIGDSKKGMRKQGSVLGQQYWKAFTEGVDVLAVSSLDRENRAFGYVIAAAAHIKLQLSKHAAPNRPLVLITVASQDQALQARRLCKTLKKTLGISSVCVHPGTSVEKQTKGFSLCTPEIVVATPERLLELLALKAISLSSVSYLVIDGLDDIVDKGFQSHIGKLKEHMDRSARKLIICDKFVQDSVIIARQLVVDPIARVMSKSNFVSRSACITQKVSVFTSINKRLPKMLHILQQFWEKQVKSMARGILVLVENTEAVEELLSTIQGIGYVAAGLTGPEDSQLELITKKIREGSVQTLVTTEEALGQVPLESMQLVINYSFPSTIKLYKQILTGMARQSVHGVLHSLCTASMAPLACHLEKILQLCSQEVPRALQMLSDAVSLVQNGKR